MVQLIAEAQLPTDFGEFRARVYRNRVDQSEHLVLLMGDDLAGAAGAGAGASRVSAWRRFRLYQAQHSRAAASAMEQIASAGEGVILYLKRESDAIANDIDRIGTRRIIRQAQHALQRARGRFPRLRHRRANPARCRRAQDDPADRQPPRLANLPGYGLEIVDSAPLSTDGGEPLDG